MSQLPHLELTENPNNKNDYIIFRHSIKGPLNKKKHTKKMVRSHNKKHSTKKKRGKKNIFNIF